MQDIHIKRGDLHLAITRAINLGRVKVTLDGAGRLVWASVDLAERDDDMLGAEGPALSEEKKTEVLRRFERGRLKPERPHPEVDFPLYEAMRAVKGERWRCALVWQALALYAHETGAPAGANTLDWFATKMSEASESAVVTDDHGPAIPAQNGSMFASTTGALVYEFALQDVKRTPAEVRLDWTLKLADIVEADAPDQEAAARADWVHVYDRVTRERGTLKRPAPDAVLTGLRGAAADLRGAARGHGKSEAVRAVVEMRTGEERYVERHMIDASQSGDPAMATAFPGPLGAPVRGAPVEPPFGCAPLPPVGPLTSTEGLRVGDWVRVTGNPVWACVARVTTLSTGEDQIVGIHHPMRGPGGFQPADLAFVGRPAADGWMPWAGGENPVPGAMIEATYADGEKSRWACESEKLAEYFIHDGQDSDSEKIVAFRIVDTAPA